MLLQKLLINHYFNKISQNESNKIDEKMTHNPTINEGGKEELVNKVLKAEWRGKPNNTSCVDFIKDGHSIEYKSTKDIGLISLNSTPITKTTLFEELTKDAQNSLSEKYEKNTVFTKEYLFYIEKFNLHICFDPEVEPSAYENRTLYNNEMKDANNLKSNRFLSVFNEINKDKKLLSHILETNKTLHDILINVKKDIDENKVLSNHENNNKYSLTNKNPESCMNLRERSMWSYDFKKFINDLGIKTKELQMYSSIIILSKNKYYNSDLTEHSDLIIIENDKIIMLGVNK